MILEDTEYAFTSDMMIYYSGKLRKRLEKLKKDIKNNSGDKYVEAFQKYYSTKVDKKTNMLKISQVCNDYYQEIKIDTMIHPKFLRHIKKVASYIGSLVDIIECACNISYKGLFANVVVRKGKSDIINQPIYSLKNIIKKFAGNDDDYNCFMKTYSEKHRVMDRMKKVYIDKDICELQQYDGDKDVKKQIYLHVEMRILSIIIDSNHKHKEYIAVSKRCCYLCEMYIEFVRANGYNIIISENHRKIYSR